MKRLLLAAILLGAVGSSGVALAQRGPVYRPPPRIEPYRPPPRIEPIRPSPQLEQYPSTVPIPPPERARAADGDDGGSNDNDGDGYTYSDCNDYDANVHPGAYDRPGGRDMNCNGSIDY